MRLDFLFIGPQRTGTSWIDRQLRTHQEIILPRKVKETFFFDRNFYKGRKWYEKQFPVDGHGKAVGEIAPSYFHCKEAPERASGAFPKCKISITLRHPAERVFSLYLHYLRNGYTDLPFSQASEKHPELISSGKYFSHISRWTHFFGRENCLFLFFKDLRLDPHQYMAKIYQFLNLEPHFVERSLSEKVNICVLPRHPLVAAYSKRLSNKVRKLGFYTLINFFKAIHLKQLLFSGSKRPLPTLSPDERKYVTNHFMKEICQLEEYLDVDLSHWKD